MKFRMRVARNRINKLILHPGITLTCLLILFALVLFGTLYQTENGLYEAQKKFFGYGIVLVGGWFPLPAASLVLWVLSVQLTITLFFILPLHLKKIGLWISHSGVLALLIGGFITQMMSVESQLTLGEGETGNYTTSYHDWELAFWERNGDTNTVFALSDGMLVPGQRLEVIPYDLALTVQAYFPNSAAFNEKVTGGKLPYVNPSGIASIEQKKPEKEVTQNVPGMVFTLHEKGKPNKEVLLYGMEMQPLILRNKGKTIFCQLRLKHYPLNIAIKLIDFKRDLHPGTDMAANYESTVEVLEGQSSRPVRIYMNNPLRYEGYTFFQASFSQERSGAERSTFAVVTNPGRLLPYISSLTVFGGLLIHFLVIFVGFIRKERLV